MHPYIGKPLYQQPSTHSTHFILIHSTHHNNNFIDKRERERKRESFIQSYIPKSYIPKSYIPKSYIPKHDIPKRD